MKFWKCLSNCDKIIPSESSVKFEFPCSNSLSCAPVEIILVKGFYYLSLFGASGGGDETQHSSVKEGFGGQAQGFYSINNTQKLFLFIGGEGQTGTTLAKGGWNGGADGAKGSRADGIFGGGGGGTDIRKGTQYQDRIVIAGGGGGCGKDAQGYRFDTHGGDGGGLNGEPSGFGVSNSRKGLGGKQIEPGKGGFLSDYSNFGNDGEIFKGGEGKSTAGSSAGGGGGGYYGGGGGYEAGGGGGSSFIDNLINGTTQTGVNKGNGYIIIQMLYLSQCPFGTQRYFRGFCLYLFVTICFSL